MSELFLFHLALPQELDLVILLLFMLLGTLNLINLVSWRSSRLLPLSLFHIAGGILGVMAQDLITLLIAWEILSISAFFLIRAGSDRTTQRYALRYLTAQIAAAALFFTAIAIQFRTTGNTRITSLVQPAQMFLFAAISIKTASMPLHFWLTESYPAAQSSITPLLSAFATKIGVLTAARLLLFEPWGVPVLAYTGALTAVAAVAFAIRQHNTRTFLSYLSISQVGHMTVAIGLVASVGNLALTAGLFHLITHTLYMSLLFMTAAEIRYSYGHENLLQMGGLWRRRPLLCICTAVGAAAIAGIPFTSGYASKELIKAAIGHGAIQYLLLIASIGTAIASIKLMYLVFFAPAVQHPITAAPTLNHQPVPAAMRMLPLAALTAATLWIGLFPDAVPGVPDKAFWESILSTLLPLAIAAASWFILKNRLTVQTGQPLEDKRSATPLTSWAAHTTWPLRHAGRVLHAQGPQLQIAVIILLLFIGITIKLV